MPHVLRFPAHPRGEPPQVLLDGPSDDWVTAPSGGAPLLVLRDPGQVRECLVDTRFGMAGMDRSTGRLRGHPLTGAEEQDPDGGFLNMDPPALLEYRRSINRLFTPSAAEASRPAAEGIARHLTAVLASRPRADIAVEYATPFTAWVVCETLGVPTGATSLADWIEGDTPDVPAGDWPFVLESSNVAFGLVHSLADVEGVDQAWEALYEHFGRSIELLHSHRGIVRGVVERLRRDRFTTSQIVHALATISNGFPAVLPVLVRCLIELLQQPATIAACLRGDRSWDEVTTRLIGTRAMFPVALPRVALDDTILGGRELSAGTLLLPSLVAAGRAGAPPSIALGAGPHFCPGAGLTWLWVTIAVRAFFEAFPQAQVAGHVEWAPGTLSVPRQLWVSLR
jgi:cytochrome P450